MVRETIVPRCRACRIATPTGRCPSCGQPADLFEVVVDDAPAVRGGRDTYRDLVVSRRKAERVLADMRRRLNSGRRPADATVALETFCLQMWLPTVHGGVSPSTYVSYRGELTRHVCPHLGDLGLDWLDERLLWRWLERLETDGRCDGVGGLAPRTVNYIRGILHRALDHAVDLGFMGSNPCPLVTPGRRNGRPPTTAPRTRRPRAWTAAETECFLDHAATHRLAVAWRMAATCGLRRGEILAVRWDDLDADANTLRVARAYVTANGQRRFTTVPPSARRRIALDADTVVGLHARRKAQQAERRAAGEAWHGHGLVVCQRNGRPTDPDNFSKTFTRLVVDARLPAMRLSDLRHMYATRLLEDGADPDEVARRLGHASGDYTLRSQRHRATDLHLGHWPPALRQARPDGPTRGT